VESRAAKCAESLHTSLRSCPDASWASGRARHHSHGAVPTRSPRSGATSTAGAANLSTRTRRGTRVDPFSLPVSRCFLWLFLGFGLCCVVRYLHFLLEGAVPSVSEMIIGTGRVSCVRARMSVWTWDGSTWSKQFPATSQRVTDRQEMASGGCSEVGYG
jgi:hypothetical protein